MASTEFPTKNDFEGEPRIEVDREEAKVLLGKLTMLEDFHKVLEGLFSDENIQLYASISPESTNATNGLQSSTNEALWAYNKLLGDTARGLGCTGEEVLNKLNGILTHRKRIGPTKATNIA